MSQHDRDKAHAPAGRDEGDVLPGTPAGEPGRAPGVLPGTPEEARETDRSRPDPTPPPPRG